MKINKIRPTAINESLCATEVAFSEAEEAQKEVEDCRKEIEKEIEAADTHKDVVFEKTIKESLNLKEDANAYLGRHGTVTVAKYREFLEEALSVCDNFNDDDEIYISSNTYRIGVPFIGTYGGYIEINNPVHTDDYDECLKEANDAEIAARKEAEKNLIEHPSLYAIIYGYHKDGEFIKYNRYLSSEEALKEETAKIESKFEPTGSVAVAYKHSLSTWESLDVKDRNELSKVIKECKENNKKFKISRSLKEGYRYTVHTAIILGDNNVIEAEDEHEAIEKAEDLIGSKDLNDLEFGDMESEVIDTKTENLEEANLDKLADEEKDAIDSYETEINNANNPKEEETLRHIKDEEEEHLDELHELENKTESLEENNLTESAWDKICAILGCDEEVEEEKVFKEHLEESENIALTESATDTAEGEAIDKLVTTGEAKDAKEAKEMLNSKNEETKETVDEMTPFDEALESKKTAYDYIMDAINAYNDEESDIEEGLFSGIKLRKEAKDWIEKKQKGLRSRIINVKNYGDYEKLWNEIVKDSTIDQFQADDKAWNMVTDWQEEMTNLLTKYGRLNKVTEELEEEKEICPECGKEVCVCECNKTLKEESEKEPEEKAAVDLGDDVEFFDSFDDVPELETEETAVKDTYDAGDFDYEEMLDSISFVTEDDDNPIEQNKTFNFDIYKTEDGKYVAFGNETPFGPANDPEELKAEIREFMKDSNFDVKEEAEAYETIESEPEEIEFEDESDLEEPVEEVTETPVEEPEEEIDLDSLDKEEPEVFEFEDESDLDL